MLTWWLTEALPIPATALLPIVVFPLTGVLDIRATCASYGHYLVFLFLGGFILARGIEKWQLHRRIALGIIRRTGDSANAIILGFMLASAFLSMWISNTATTVMMLPIAASVIGLLQGTDTSAGDAGWRKFALGLMLGIAYAANVGGISTLIGTPPNVAMQAIMEDNYGIAISFSRWMLLATPFAAVLLVLTYAVLTQAIYRNGIGVFEGAKALIKQESKALGALRGGELRVLLVFAGTALLWVFRGLINEGLEAAGWAFPISDTGIAMLGGISLFVINSDQPKERLLAWSDTRDLPWGILLLFGGGLALASAFKATGLVDTVAHMWSNADGLGQVGFVLALTASSLFLTELMSNLALVQVFVPIVAAVGVGMGLEPLLFAVPVTMAASCAFMFPMSTPPNAIVFASGHIRMSDMARAGIWLNLLAIALIGVLASVFLERWLAGLG